jgi:hypothetical protein
MRLFSPCVAHLCPSASLKAAPQLAAYKRGARRMWPGGIGLIPIHICHNLLIYVIGYLRLGRSTAVEKEAHMTPHTPLSKYRTGHIQQRGVFLRSSRIAAWSRGYQRGVLALGYVFFLRMAAAAHVLQRAFEQTTFDSAPRN